MSDDSSLIPAGLAGASTDEVIDQTQALFGSLCLDPKGARSYIYYIAFLVLSTIVSLALWVYMRLTRHALLARLSTLEDYRIVRNAEAERRNKKARRQFRGLRGKKRKKESRRE